MVQSCYTIVSSSKGGIVYHFRDNKSPVINQGLVFRNELGEYASSQKTTSVEFKNKSNEIIISTRVIQMTKRLPTPFLFDIEDSKFSLKCLFCVNLLKIY